jgi:hypothetical protein
VDAHVDAAAAEPETERGAWAEDFATAVLIQIPRKRRGGGGGADAGESKSHAGEGGSEPPVSRDEGEGATDRVPNGDLGRAQLVVCGHPAPYLIRSGRALALEPESPTLPLGLGSLTAEPYAVTSSTVAFEPGDALVLYTDGVSDARSRSGAFFRLDEALRGLGELAPAAAASLVRSRLLEHTRGALSDDAALLVLRRVGGDGVSGPDDEGDESGAGIESGAGGTECSQPSSASLPGSTSGRSDDETPVRVNGAAW